jgi:hypothetical protein
MHVFPDSIRINIFLFVPTLFSHRLFLWQLNISHSADTSVAGMLMDLILSLNTLQLIVARNTTPIVPPLNFSTHSFLCFYLYQLSSFRIFLLFSTPLAERKEQRSQIMFFLLNSINLADILSESQFTILERELKPAGCKYEKVHTAYSLYWLILGTAYVTFQLNYNCL